jgi:hypothetical protein
MLVHDGASDITQVHRLGQQWDPAGKLSASEVENIFNHALHASTGALDLLGVGMMRRALEAVVLEHQLRGHQDRVQRAAEVVADGTEKQILDPLSVSAALTLHAQSSRVQPDEGANFSSQHFGVERLR